MSFVRSFGAGLVLSLAVSGCSGMAGDPDGGMDAGTFDAGFDAGPPPIKYEQFIKRSDGWPAGAKAKGAATLDNVLYVASDQGLHAMPNTETKWTSVTLPLVGDEKPTSFQRVDQSLVLTAAGTSSGGLYVKPLDGAWARVAASPSAPTWLLGRKSGEWLLATTGALHVAQSLSGPWTRRSAVNTMVFAAPVTRFVAAPSQQKIFAAGDTGGLFESIDTGATWAASAPRGTVQGVAAQGAYVITATSMDGQQRSDNYGNTFRPVQAALTSDVLTYVAQDARFWAGTTGGLFVSDDDGANWVEADDGLPPGTSVRALWFAQGYVVVDTPDGVFVNQQ